MSNTVPEAKPSVPGVVSADCIYTLAEIKQRLQLGAAAMREARRKGLKVRTIGRRRYVLGRDLLEFVETVQQ